MKLLSLFSFLSISTPIYQSQTPIVTEDFMSFLCMSSAVFKVLENAHCKFWGKKLSNYLT